MKKLILAVLPLAILTACGPDLKSDKGKYSYAIGHNVGRNMKAQNLELDQKAFRAAIEDALGDKKAQMTEEEMINAMRSLNEVQRAKETADSGKNKEAGDKFLADNKGKDGVKATKSGLQYKVVTEGKGKKPKADDVVEVHYRGKLIDGTEFDSSYSRNRPAQFPVNAVIPGWTEALQLMPVGSKYELYIPSELGYGDRGNAKIPGNSVLVFEVELLQVVKK